MGLAIVKWSGSFSIYGHIRMMYVIMRAEIIIGVRSFRMKN